MKHLTPLRLVSAGFVFSLAAVLVGIGLTSRLRYTWRYPISRPDNYEMWLSLLAHAGLVLGVLGSMIMFTGLIAIGVRVGVAHSRDA